MEKYDKSIKEKEKQNSMGSNQTQEEESSNKEIKNYYISTETINILCTRKENFSKYKSYRKKLKLTTLEKMYLK